IVIALASTLCAQGVPGPIVRPGGGGSGGGGGGGGGGGFGYGNIFTDPTLRGNASNLNPLGLAQTPITPPFGGTGLPGPPAHSVCIGEGLLPFNCLQLDQDQTLVGTSATSDPIITNNKTLGSEGHLQVRSNPPAVDCPNATGPSVV